MNSVYQTLLETVNNGSNRFQRCDDPLPVSKKVTGRSNRSTQISDKREVSRYYKNSNFHSGWAVRQRVIAFNMYAEIWRKIQIPFRAYFCSLRWCCEKSRKLISMEKFLMKLQFEADITHHQLYINVKLGCFLWLKALRKLINAEIFFFISYSSQVDTVCKYVELCCEKEQTSVFLETKAFLRA